LKASGPMGILLCVCLVLLCMGIPGISHAVDHGPGTADSDFLAKENHFTLDASAAAVTIAYARSTRGGSFIGGEAGGGFEWASYTPAAGPHFQEGQLHELCHLAGFWRYQPSVYWQTDVGARGSLFIHDTGNMSAAYFAGLYFGTYIGWRYIKFGPRALIGVVTEGGDRTEFCVHIMVMTARIMLPW
jgi:hypothetical protein